MATPTKWQISGEYFENCSCDIVCPCLISAAAPLTSKPTQGYCEVAMAIHVDRGTYGDVKLEDLNVVVVIRTPGPMGEGNASAAAYIDQRADDRQAEALGAIFSGAAGGPVAALAPLIATNLGVKRIPITYKSSGKTRSVAMPSILHMSVHALPSMRADGGEIWASAGHPFNPDKLAMAVGDEGNSYADYGMKWNNSGKNAHYAAIAWSN